MLLNLQAALERHRGVNRQVAWPRVKTSMTREEAYQRLLRPGTVLAADVKSALKEGQDYPLQTPAGETLSGRVEFVREQRGFCVTVRELKNALLLFTIEGSPGNIEVQA